jgi:hypothetical protein
MPTIGLEPTPAFTGVTDKKAKEELINAMQLTDTKSL